MSTATATNASSVRTGNPPVRTRQQRTIQGALPIVARAIGRRVDVTVEIGGTEAKTDGRVIRLPTLPFHDPEVETLAFGFLEHEAAHIRYTRDVESKSELHHRLCNTIEDIRIERELAREFPGFASTLSRLVTKLVKDDGLKRPSDANPLGVKLRLYLSYRLRAEVLQQSGLTDYAAQAETIFRQAFTPGASVRIGSIIGRVPALRSTQEASDLAGEILSILEDEAQDPPPPPPPPDSAEASTDNGTTPGNAGASDGSETAPGSTTDGALVDPNAQGRANIRELLNDQAPDLGPELSDAASDALKDAAGKAVRESGGRSGGFGRADTPISPPPGDPGRVLAEVHEASMALRTRLRSLVESVRHTRRSYTRQGTRLAPQRVVRAMLGDPRLFAVKRPGREVNSAIEILCDRSLSMAGRRMAVAARCTLATASGLTAIRGVSVEAAVFPGCHGEIELLTRFDEPFRSTATRYAAITAQGGTPMYEALIWGCERLLMRSEPRKMLVCLTDGEPPRTTVRACQEVVAAAIAGGIEVYAIGIDVPSIATLFPVAQSIDDVSELAGALFGFLQAALTGVRSV